MGFKILWIKTIILTVLKTGRKIVVVPVLIEGETVIGVFAIDIFFVPDVTLICCLALDKRLIVGGDCLTWCRNVAVAVIGLSEIAV